jgi:hypothetical protein
MAIEGVDYAGDHPNPAQLYAAGKRFAVRYGGPGGSWKHLTAAEARALIAARLSIVANAEGTASGLLGGRSAGESWARSADAHFRALGMPAARPIYLSVDFDVTSGQWPACREALRGAASVIGAARVGVYGGRRAIEWARRDSVARWFWQTYAWSGGVWVSGNHLEQYRNGVSLAGGTVDLCRAKVADYGQWGQPIREEGVSAQDVADAFKAGGSRTGDVGRAVDTGFDGMVSRLFRNNSSAKHLMATVNQIKAAVVTGQAAMLRVDEAVVAQLGDVEQTPEQLAAILRPLLGDRAAAVGALLADSGGDAAPPA